MRDWKRRASIILTMFAQISVVAMDAFEAKLHCGWHCVASNGHSGRISDMVSCTGLCQLRGERSMGIHYLVGSLTRIGSNKLAADGLNVLRRMMAGRSPYSRGPYKFLKGRFIVSDDCSGYGRCLTCLSVRVQRALLRARQGQSVADAR
jgi:hypothetical protein